MHVSGEEGVGQGGGGGGWQRARTVAAENLRGMRAAVRLTIPCNTVPKG
jgi:hypothetical protein